MLQSTQKKNKAVKRKGENQCMYFFLVSQDNTLLFFARAFCDKRRYFSGTVCIDNLYTMVYSIIMHKILQTETYKNWFKKLRDEKAKFAIGQRIGRMTVGNFGDSKTVGSGVFELRIDVGKGYRVYFTNNGKRIVILLVGGDKSTQDADIKSAKKMAEGIDYGKID